MCHAYGACVVRCVSRACRPCSVPGFPARGLHLEHGIFSQAKKTGPSAHQARNNNLPVTSSTRPTHKDQSTYDRYGRRSRHSIQQHPHLRPLPAVPAPALFTAKHLPSDGGLLWLPGYPDECAWMGLVPTWSKPCALCCDPLVAETTNWSRKLEGEFMLWYSGGILRTYLAVLCLMHAPLGVHAPNTIQQGTYAECDSMNSPSSFLDQVVVPATKVSQRNAQGLLQVSTIPVHAHPRLKATWGLK